MSKVIFLNGCGSAGKTSVAKSIQHLSTEAWLRFGVDMFIDMMPSQYIAFGDKASSGYFSFVAGSNEYGQTMKVEPGPKGGQVFGLMPKFAGMLASEGNNVIIDEVLLNDNNLTSYIMELRQHKVYFVGVFCELKAMQEREILRGDRAIGLSSEQINRVHKGLREYDIKVDTTTCSPFVVAKQILDFMSTNPEPQSFVKMDNELRV